MRKIVPVVIACLYDEKKRFLLTYRSEDGWKKDSIYNNVWNFPGGSIQFGEKPEQAVQREAYEELGVHLSSLTRLSKLFTDSRSGWQGIFVVFFSSVSSVKTKVQLNNEASKWAWFNLHDIKKLHTLPLTYKIACSVLAEI